MTTTAVLDAAMGTALLDAGLPRATVPEVWLLEHPDRIARVHAAHAEAGATVLLTCTFNLAAPRLDEARIAAPVEDLARRGVAIARAAAPSARVAGAIGPTLLAGKATNGERSERYGRAFRALASAGADLLWIESHWDLDEARAALAASRGTGLASVVTFTFRDEGGIARASGGEPAQECLEAVAADGAVAVGFNCSLPGAPLEEWIAVAATRIRVPIVAKPSAGLPGAILSPAEFGSWGRALTRAGASWIGGCCGTTAAHVAAVRAVCARSP